MTDEFSTWLDGAPVIPTPGGNEFGVWLDGAPVVTGEVSSGAITVIITGSKALAKGGDVIVRIPATVTITGSKALAKGGDVLVSIPVTVQITGSRALAKGGSVIVIGPVPPVPPVPPIPSGFGGYVDTRPARRTVKRYSRKRHEVQVDLPESELPEIELPVIREISLPVVVRISGSKALAKGGFARVRIPRTDDDEEVIEVMMALVSSSPRQHRASESLPKNPSAAPRSSEKQLVSEDYSPERIPLQSFDNTPDDALYRSDLSEEAEVAEILEILELADI